MILVLPLPASARLGPPPAAAKVVPTTNALVRSIGFPAPSVVQYLHAVSPAHPLTWPTPAGPRAAALPKATGVNGSSCDPYWPASMPIGLAAINGSVTWTGNTTGATPLNLSWSIVIGGGGIPPYQTYVEIEPYVGGNLTWNSTNLTGNVSLTVPGMYVGFVEVVDSTCDAIGESLLGPVTVYDPSGLDPVQISASTAGGTVPLAVAFSLNLSRVPTNASMLWETPFSYDSDGWTINTTYYQPGNDTATGCLVNPTTGAWLACGNSSAVAVTGSDLTTAVSVGNGTLPVNITFWVNVTNGSALPAGWTVNLDTDNGTLLENASQNASTSLTGSFGCGPEFLTNPANAAGMCPWVASYFLEADPGGTPVYVTGGTIWANLTENGSPVLWYPTVTYTESPTNGSAPLNVTVNVTASNGLAPYQYWWAVVGASSALPNQTYFPTATGNGSGWNGSLLALSFSFPHLGIYRITVTVRDSDLNYVFLYPPVVPVGVALAPRPLHVSTSEGAAAAAGPNATRVAFVANVSGGEGPYALQWTFGDGTYGSSLPGVPVTHTYASAGTFVPTVTVTDETGATQTSTLPAVVILPTPSTGNQSSPGTTGPSHGASGNGGGPSGWLSLGTDGWVGGFLVLGALALVVVGAVQVERQRSAEQLVRRLESDTASGKLPPMGG
ncbi:MAG: PKD domain-containing protein [Thermoplasmata archaeon]|nr:PKD domain-containing protein [Thermoplasmata archaeon]